MKRLVIIGIRQKIHSIHLAHSCTGKYEFVNPMFMFHNSSIDSSDDESARQRRPPAIRYAPPDSAGSTHSQPQDPHTTVRETFFDIS